MRRGQNMSRITSTREVRGLTQTELARKMGVAPSTVSRLESGDRKLTTEYLQLFARALGVSEAELVSEAVAEVDRRSLTFVQGSAGLNSWSVPNMGETPSETIPVVQINSMNTLAHNAWLMSDSHAEEIAPKGAYAISVPLEGLRPKPLDGQWIVVLSTEGRMQRHTIHKVRVDQRGVWAEINGKWEELARDHKPIDLVVSVYRELN
jgi:transcriptional regulator with XRE-family HTH domain